MLLLINGCSFIGGYAHVGKYILNVILFMHLASVVYMNGV